MSNFDEVGREHVPEALAEHDELTEVDAPVPWQDATEVGPERARTAWAEAAREVLVDSARRYRTVVTYKELSSQVQHRSGIRTSQLVQHWIGDVLGRVAAECAARGEPNLSSLCVNAQGSVGAGYVAGETSPEGIETGDLDDEAARERLACYLHFDADGLPADGGSPALTPQVAATRSRTRKAAHAARPVATCPTCHMALPATGVCDECD